MSAGTKRIVAQRLETVLGVPLSAPKHLEQKPSNAVRAPGQSDKTQLNANLTSDGGRNSVEKVLPHSNANRSVAQQAQARAQTFSLDPALMRQGQASNPGASAPSSAPPPSIATTSMSSAAKAVLDLMRLLPSPARLDLGQISSGKQLKMLSSQRRAQVFQQAISQALVRSGIFYESTLSKEPSRQALQALHQSAQASSVGTIDVDEPLTQNVIRQQVDLLSGAALGFQFMLDEDFYAYLEAKNSDVISGDDDERRFCVSLRIDHPARGLIEVVLQTHNGELSVSVRSEKEITERARGLLSDVLSSIGQFEQASVTFNDFNGEEGEDGEI